MARQIQSLSGPISFYYYPNLSAKRILLLGDYHSKINVCAPSRNNKAFQVQDWLKQLAIEAPSCLDIFIEDGFLAKSTPSATQTGGSQSSLTDVKKEFFGCYYNNLCLRQSRIHQIDIRQLLDIDNPQGGLNLKNPLIRIITENMSNLKSFKIEINSQFYEQRKMVLFSYLMGIDRSGNARLLYEYFLRDFICNNGIPNQLEYYNSIIASLDPYIKYYWSQIDSQVAQMDPIINKDKFFDDFLAMYSSRPLMGGLVEIPMDICFLTLLFTQLNRTQLQEGPIGCQSNQIKYVILYAGNDHIDRYVTFFERHFGVKPDPTYQIKPKLMANGKPNQCLQLAKPFDFFA